LSPRETRVVALPAPSERDQTRWYFQRYVEHLPAAAEFVLFNRSWTTVLAWNGSWGFAAKMTRSASSTMHRFSSKC
jgi:polyphosphate kinase 2 (PPK2 family)